MQLSLALLALLAVAACASAAVGPIANEAAVRAASSMLATSPSSALTLLGSTLLQDTKSRVSGMSSAAGCVVNVVG